MCLVDVNLLSKYISRYFSSFTLGRGRSCRLMVGQAFLVVNVGTDFVSLAFMCHLSSHVWISENCFWRILDAISRCRCATRISLSSAYVVTVTSRLIGRSAVYIYIGLVPARSLVALQTWLDGILICRVHVVRKIVWCISTFERVRSIEVGLFLFCRVDGGARLCQKLVGCLGKLQTVFLFFDWVWDHVIPSVHLLLCWVIVSKAKLVIRYKFIFVYWSF